MGRNMEEILHQKFEVKCFSDSLKSSGDSSIVEYDE